MLQLEPSQRSESDKDFYRKAEAIQRASTLPDGCGRTDYAKKALAFLTHIHPNLPAPMADDDTTLYLINLMPKGLREGTNVALRSYG
jgi:hypothetical protein